MRVALCIPAYDGRVHDAHMASIVKTMRLAAVEGMEIQLIMGRGNPVLPDVRNWLVAMAMSYGCDKVWMVDSDIAWERSVPETLNMLRMPVDIVGAVYQKRNIAWNSPGELIVHWDKIPPEQDELTGLPIVNRLGTGFICIDRSVFERLAEAGIARNYLPGGKIETGNHFKFYRNYFWYDFVPKPHDEAMAKHLSEVGYDGPMEMIQGEDFYFCRKAKEVGARLFIDPRVKLVHFDGCVQHTLSMEDVRFEPAKEN